MRILVGNHHLAAWCGSETFTATLVRELVRQGHTVEVFACVLGEVSESLAPLARVVCRQYLSRLRWATEVDPEPPYDLVLTSHHTAQQAAEGLGRVHLTICHGVVPDLEQPHPGADGYVAVSEEVRDHLASHGFASTVIRNGVDTGRFRPYRHLPARLERVLLLSNYDGAEPVVREATEAVGARFRRVGGASAVPNVAGAIDEADLVVTVGRGAYEAMSAGRNVVIFDRRDYDEVQGADGFVTPDDLPQLLTHNCSGRTRSLRWGAPELADALRRYDPAMGNALRDYAVEHLDVRVQVERTLALAAEILRTKDATVEVRREAA
jgi:hypothetical protein